MKVTARVQMTIDIDAGSSWDVLCPCGQVFDQARKEAELKVRNLLCKTDLRIIGPVKCNTVFSTTESDE